MKIINFGHACFEIVSGDFKLLFDPYQDNSVPGLKLPEIEVNNVLISHDHHDHNAENLIHINNKKRIDVEVVLVPHDKVNGKLRGMNKIHIVNIENTRLAHFGDLGIIPEKIDKLKNIDIALVPINGFYTIGAIEAISLYKKIGAKCIIPMHYYNKNLKNGYEDDDQIEKFLNEFENINFIDSDEFEFSAESKGAYVFKKVRN